MTSALPLPFRCHDCPACDLQRRGCACDELEDDEGTPVPASERCFVCVPGHHPIPACVPRGAAVTLGDGTVVTETAGDAMIAYQRKKKAYELLVADLDALLEGFGPDSVHVEALRTLLFNMARPPRFSPKWALKGRGRAQALVYATVEALFDSLTDPLPIEPPYDGDIAFVNNIQAYFAYDARTRTWARIMQTTTPTPREMWETQFTAGTPAPRPWNGPTLTAQEAWERFQRGLERR